MVPSFGGIVTRGAILRMSARGRRTSWNTMLMQPLFAKALRQTNVFRRRTLAFGPWGTWTRYDRRFPGMVQGGTGHARSAIRRLAVGHWVA